MVDRGVASSPGHLLHRGALGLGRALGSVGRAALVAAVAAGTALAAEERLASETHDMAEIPSGSYTPQYRAEGAPEQVQVDGFRLDRHPVTNAEFLAFVEARPEWRRDRVPEVFAESGYLAHWAEATRLGPSSPARAPVVNVSWFAARAFCEWEEKTLPTADQWEYAASADEERADAATSPEFYTRILDWYSRPTQTPPPDVETTFQNLWGVWDLHGLVWEWVDDFASSLVTGESRADEAVEKQLYCAAGSVGAADFRNYASFMRYAFRSSLEARYTVKNLGFRCAAPLE